MRANADRLERVKSDIEDLQQKLAAVPEPQKGKTVSILKEGDDLLKKIPATDAPVFVHIIGTDKSFKTSYLLDLIGNDELRTWFDIQHHNMSENTAVPCLIQPDSRVDKIIAQHLILDTQKIEKDNLTPQEFKKLYDLGSGAKPKNNMLRVLVPSHATKFSLPVIEYPGMKKGADPSAEQKIIHQTFTENMLQLLKKFPGILVACFYQKVSIPEGHPIDAVLKEYAKYLKTDHPQHKLPLILSLQGETAITSYCGNTNVLQDIEKDFKSYQLFETYIQLVNPNNAQHAIQFSQPSAYVDVWRNKLSKYKSIQEIHENITKDGGINWSRVFLEAMCHTSHIREALDNIYLRPWIEEGDRFLDKALPVYDEILSTDIVQDTRKKIQEKVLAGKYKTVRDCFQQVFQKDKSKEPTTELWEKVFIEYLKQFLGERQDYKDIAGDIWQKLIEKLDVGEKGFLATKQDAIPYIILNVAELYVPNALLRGESVIYRRVNQ